MELLQMFYGGEPFSFCLPDEGQIYGVTRRCHSRVQFWKHTRTLPLAHKHTHKQQTDELFRMYFVFVGSRLGDSQPACIHDLVWHSRQRAYHMHLIWTWRMNWDSRKQFFHQKSLAWSDDHVCMIRYFLLLFQNHRIFSMDAACKG